MKPIFQRAPRLRAIALIAAPLCFVAACATGEPPVAKLATAREAIRQAESAGAPQLAPVEMMAARDKLNRAEAAAQDKQYAQAARLTDEATADADLAERTARAQRAARAQQEVQQSNAVLSDELSRKAPTQ